MTNKYIYNDIKDKVSFCAHCHDPASEYKTILELLNQAYEEGKKDMLVSSDAAVDAAIDAAYDGGHKEGYEEGRKDEHEFILPACDQYPSCAHVMSGHTTKYEKYLENDLEKVSIENEKLKEENENLLQTCHYLSAVNQNLGKSENKYTELLHTCGDLNNTIRELRSIVDMKNQENEQLKEVTQLRGTDNEQLEHINNLRKRSQDALTEENAKLKRQLEIAAHFRSILCKSRDKELKNG